MRHQRLLTKTLASPSHPPRQSHQSPHTPESLPEDLQACFWRQPCLQSCPRCILESDGPTPVAPLGKPWVARTRRRIGDQFGQQRGTSLKGLSGEVFGSEWSRVDTDDLVEFNDRYSIRQVVRLGVSMPSAVRAFSFRLLPNRRRAGGISAAERGKF